jgi:hypothetical protein
MRSKLAVVAILAVALVLGTVTLAAGRSNGSSGANGAQTINLFVLTVQDQFLDLGPQGLSLGDEDVFSDDLFTSKGGSKVGFDGGKCTAVRLDKASNMATFQCLVTVSLKGGQITIQGLITFSGSEVGSTFTLAVTGGTGAYEGVSGQATITETSQTEATVRLHLLKRNDS